MIRVMVVSKVLHIVGYDEKEKTLSIRFLTGQLLYHYNVPKEIYNILKNTVKPEEFYFTSVRNHYKYSIIL